MGIGRDRIDPHELLELRTSAAITEHVKEVADRMLEEREAEVGAEAWATIERFVLLRTIDSLWVEHLTEVDDMRRGIGLRGYAQQDPLNEFRREAYRMYEEFRDMIRHGVATSIFRVTVQRQPPSGGDGAVADALARGAEELRRSSGNGAGAGSGAETKQPVAAGAAVAGSAILRGSLPKAPAVRNVTASLGGEPITDGGSDPGLSVAGGGADPGGARPGYTPTGARIGRNDPCWCGSGAKYKKCHGR